MPKTIRDTAISQADRIALRLMGALVDSTPAAPRPNPNQSSNGDDKEPNKSIDPLIAAHVTMSTIDSAFDIRGWARRFRFEDIINSYGKVLFFGLFCNE